jgi:hypothetical protein
MAKPAGLLAMLVHICTLGLIYLSKSLIRAVAQTEGISRQQNSVLWDAK